MRIEPISKFSDTMISIRSLLPFESKTITAINLMSYMLKSKTEKYDSKEAIAKELNKRYGMKVTTGLATYGDSISYQMRFQFIRYDWIKNEAYTSQVIEAMDQFLFHSVLEEESLAEAKYLLKNRLVSQMDDPAYLSLITAMRSASPEHSISIPVGGYLEEIDSITLEDIQKMYDIYQNAKKHVFVCGIINDEIKAYLESVDVNEDIEANYTLISKNNEFEQVIQKEIEQTYVSLIYATNVDITSKDYYSLLIMNSILGQAPMNLLFENVREKNSLCYSVSSSIIRFDGVLYIHLGTKKHQVNQALDLINQQIQRLKDQDYDDMNLEIAKKDMLDGMVGNLDYPTFYIETKFLDDMLDRNETLQDRMKWVSEVTKEDVARVAKSLQFVSKCIVEENEDAL